MGLTINNFRGRNDWSCTTAATPDCTTLSGDAILTRRARLCLLHSVVRTGWTASFTAGLYGLYGQLPGKPSKWPAIVPLHTHTTHLQAWIRGQGHVGAVCGPCLPHAGLQPGRLRSAALLQAKVFAAHRRRCQEAGLTAACRIQAAQAPCTTSCFLPHSQTSLRCDWILTISFGARACKRRTRVNRIDIAF